MPVLRKRSTLSAYEELRGRLNTKRSNAPTPGLNEKYSKTLLQLDEAIETGEASFDEKEMPTFKIAASEAVILPNEAVVASTDSRKRAKHGGVLSSSRYEYETPAVEAVRRWRFKPAEKMGYRLPRKSGRRCSSIRDKN